MKYIISGTSAEYLDYLHRTKMRRAEARRVTSPDGLRGLRLNPNQIVFTGSWRTRKDAKELEQMAAHATSKMVR